MFKVTESTIAKHACEQQFREVFWHRHHGGKRVRWRTAYENANLEWASFFERLLMVTCDVPLDLVMQSAFFIWGVVVPGNLYAVHAYVCLQYTGGFARACGDLRKRDKCAAVHRPADQLRQIFQAAFFKILDAT